MRIKITLVGFNFLVFGFVISIMTGQCQSLPDACHLFYNELKKLPGKKAELSYHKSIQRSIESGKESAGCEIRFGSNDTALAYPDLITYWTDPESNIYKKGWRINDRWTADGPDGSMSFALEKDSVRCNILNSALYPDEVKLGNTNVVVQCHEITD